MLSFYSRLALKYYIPDVTVEAPYLTKHVEVVDPPILQDDD